jgi:hypothetical protein
LKEINCQRCKLTHYRLQDDTCDTIMPDDIMETIKENGIIIYKVYDKNSGELKLNSIYHMSWWEKICDH